MRDTIQLLISSFIEFPERGSTDGSTHIPHPFAMKVIYTRHFPPGSFHGINLFGVVFVQRRWGEMAPEELNHELIHTLQQWEMEFLLFYLWYGVEYVVRLVQYRFDATKAYYNISFEREAYANERNLDYLRKRRVFSWWRYLREDTVGKGGCDNVPAEGTKDE